MVAITIDLDTDLEMHLRETAARRGQTTAEYLRELAEQAAPPVKPALSHEEWLALLERAPPAAANAPGIPGEALRRENMYEDRI